MACCDPAVNLLARAQGRTEGVRLIALMRSSGQALDLLKQELIHAAGVHIGDASQASGNVSSLALDGFRLARVANWRKVLPCGQDLRYAMFHKFLCRAFVGWPPA